MRENIIIELSNGICSLNAGKDRFALSCSMEIDSKGKVISGDVYKSVIRVTERMSYTDVNKILNNYFYTPIYQAITYFT